jgi:hypothetical protein
VGDIRPVCKPVLVGPIFPTPRTEHYSPELLSKVLERLEPQAVWLVLSMDHYGWRSHVDLAHHLVGDEPSEGGDLVGHHLEHRVMAGIEELFLLLDQLWRMVRGISAHRGGGRFLEGYCARGHDLAAEVEALRSLEAAQWEDLLRLPTEPEIRERFGPPHGSSEDADWFVAYRSEVLRLCVLNVEEVCAFFERPESPMPGFDRTGLRDTNNAYRHGTRILYEDCSPTLSGWVVGNPETRQGLLLGRAEAEATGREQVVNVLQALPDESGRAHLAAVPLDVGWRQSLIDGMANLSVLLRRLARSFLVAEALGIRPSSSLEEFAWSPIRASSEGP